MITLLCELATDFSEGRLPFFIQDREGRLLHQSRVGGEVDESSERPACRCVLEKLVVDILGKVRARKVLSVVGCWLLFVAGFVVSETRDNTLHDRCMQLFQRALRAAGQTSQTECLFSPSVHHLAIHRTSRGKGRLSPQQRCQASRSATTRAFAMCCIRNPRLTHPQQYGAHGHVSSHTLGFRLPHQLPEPRPD